VSGFIVESASCGVDPGDLLDLRPSLAPGRKHWVALLRNGDLIRIDFATGSKERIADLDLKWKQDDPRVDLYLEPNGEFCAVVERHGQFGAVYELSTGRITFQLDRGDYFPRLSVFPVAFLTHAGRTRVVHGTSWNRLDVSDAETGKLLTARVDAQHDDRERYLDYFHGTLSVSPDGKWIADNGWIWHPSGIVRVWNVVDWLKSNPYESESGDSAREIGTFNQDCDVPFCWVGKAHLAIWGIGGNFKTTYAGLRVFDVTTGNLQMQISQADSPIEHVEANHERPPWFVWDKWLFDISPVRGTLVWDLESGERIGSDKALKPRRYHPVSRQLLDWNEEEFLLIQWQGR